jgi:RNA polymerase sigma-70 factor (ECF subfamily)
MSITADQGENNLLSRAAAGSNAAFDDLVGPLIEPGYRLALAMLGREAEARDAVQEATFRAWRKLGQLRDQGKLRTWFMAIVVNQCRSARRKRWWHVLELSGSAENVDGQRLWGQSALRQAIAELAAGDQAVLFLFFYLDLSVDEVASALKVSPAAAKSRIYRAVHRLKLGVNPLEVV